MNLNYVKVGLRVKTANLGTTQGMLIKAEYLQARQSGAAGEIVGYFPGHGGDVWAVRHDSGEVAAYMFTEFEPA